MMDASGFDRFGDIETMIDHVEDQLHRRINDGLATRTPHCKYRLTIPRYNRRGHA